MMYNIKGFDKRIYFSYQLAKRKLNDIQHKHEFKMRIRSDKEAKAQVT